MPYNEQIFIIDDNISTIKYIPRETLRRVATPQCYKFDLLNNKYKEAVLKKIGMTESSYTNTMMVELGVRLYFGLGSDRNIKLTTPGDIEIFEAMLEKKMNRIELQDIANVGESKLNWNKLSNKSILISGGTGFIGSFFVM